MSEKDPFNTEEENKIAEILSKAIFIKDKNERIAFVEKECGGNRLMFERIKEDLDEMDDGESDSFYPPIESGEEIGNYIIIKEISQGGFATVYMAEHKILGNLAAVKVFNKLDVKDIANDMFWNKDHSSLSRFNHENIVKLYDVGFYESNESRLPYIAIEYIKGKHLDKYCTEKDLPIREVLRLFQDLCRVVEFVHDKEILHLDLKPNNILVTADRPHRIKLIDFGSSKLFRSESKQFTRSDLFNPVSLKFAAPEQFDKDEELTVQADVYSLGVILYLLITEKVPFGEEEDDRDKITKEVTDKTLLPVLPSKRVLELEDKTKFGVPLKTLGHFLHGDLECIIMKALEKRRRNRYASVSELRQDIDNFLKGKPVKARRHTFGYRTIKKVSQILGFKGGLVGWDKWKTPVKRLSVFSFVLVVVSIVSIIGIIYYFMNQAVAKRIEKPQDMKEIRTYNEIGLSVYKKIPYINIRCGPKEQEEICFTLLQIPEGKFDMGRRSNERFPDISEDDKNRPIEAKDKTKPIKIETQNKSALIGEKEPPKVSSYVGEEEKFADPTRFGIKITKFYMTKFEITNKQWNIVAKSQRVNIDLQVTDNDNSLPKTNVSFSEVKEFCDRLSADLSSNEKKIVVRLPSEAEWEYACRAGGLENSKYGGAIKPETKFINAIIFTEERPDPLTEVVMKKINTPWLESSFDYANLYGLVAMNGNVWEIVSDEWHMNYEGAPENGVSWGDLTKSSTNNSEKKYVLRGGAFNKEAYMTQCSYRKSEEFLSPGNDQIGFRIVMEASAE